VTFQDDLPSAGGTGGIDLGPAAVATLNGQVYVLDEGGGASHGNPLTPDGIYAVDGSGSVRLVADLGGWVQANPVANPPEDLDPDGDIVAMVAAGGALLVVEMNHGQLLRVTPDGEISRVADLSEGAMRPSGVAAAPDGSVYVSMQTQEPYVEGAANVVSVADDGTFTDVWTGLTAATAVALGPDGTLYALEFGTPDDAQPLGVAPETGRVLRQTGPDSAQEITVGIDTPLAMAFGPDQMLYVSTPAITTDGPTGAVIRLDLAQGQVMTMSSSVLAGSPCIPTPTPTTTPDATAVSSPTPGSGTPDPGTPDSAQGQAVSIENFAFNPDTVTITAGTTVTWTNNDTVAHTVTSTDGAFDSGNIAPGESFTFTFSDAGTFDYICSYHPNMQGTVTVQ
jgi:plastocyanin